MKAGIFVHSNTGNTYHVAQRLKEKLDEKGCISDLKRISFSSYPEAPSHDWIIFASPVHGGNISDDMKAYLSQIKSLKDKKVSCLVTQFFPSPRMGGDKAIAQMKEILESKGALVKGTGIVNWMSLRRKKKINDVTENISALTY